MPKNRTINATHLVISNFTRAFSPLTLNQEWSKIGRLIFMVVTTTIGTIMNGFFISSFIVEGSLRKKGNVFLACAGLADLAVSSVVITTSAVLLLSGQWDTVPVCNATRFLTEASAYSYNIFYALVALENYTRICRPFREYAKFLSIRMGVLSTMVFAVCFTVSGVGMFMDLNYDYCERKHHGNFYFKSATAVLFYALPCVLTMFGLIAATVEIRRRARKQVQYRRSHQYDLDYSSTALNIAAYVVFILGWTPYLIIVYNNPDTSDSNFYNSAWTGILRTVVTSFLYACFHRNYRRAFAHLFNYCCCKSTRTRSFTTRQRRSLECKQSSGDLHVHVMHICFGRIYAGRCRDSYETSTL